jgi:Ser/Thr protein kinase RdoA (MazF antagonist)
MDDVTTAMDEPGVRAICRKFVPDGSLAIAPLRGAGFSGSRVYRVQTCGRDRDETFVCKAFAAGVDSIRAAWVHRLMRILREAGVAEVPAVAATPAGDTIVTDRAGTHWELIEFRGGLPTAAPTPGQAEAAVVALARMHDAASRGVAPARAAGMPACVLRRIRMAERMLGRPWTMLRRLCDSAQGHGPGRVPAADVAARLERAARLLPPTTTHILRWIARLDLVVPDLRPVLRDVWADHVLFVDGTAAVGGIIDYHAAAIDSPATDIARLLGSWRPPGREGTYFAAWGPTLAAYERIRPLQASERLLIPLLAATGVLFGLDTWFHWLIEEERLFPRPDAALGRIDGLLAELPNVLEFLADRAGRGGLTG